MATYNDVEAIIDAQLASGTQITADLHRFVEKAILAFARDQWLTGDIKEIDCTQQYILDNFETSGPNQGRGIVGGPREGWAICNGFNGTRNRTGRVSVAWGLTGLDVNGNDISQPVMNTGVSPFIVGGNKSHQLTVSEMPTHAHEVQWRLDATTSGDFYTIGNTPGGDEGTWGPVQPGGTNANGSFRVRDNGSGTAHNNMQPYIVTLFIQKL